ncbi:hypothetical protein [Flagellimonas sp. 2504JD4-2]
MIRTIALFFLICIGIANSVCAQHQIKDSNELEGYRSIPQEHVYMHINDTFLLSGEYLYYKLYCLEASSRAPSAISKIAYIELVGSDGEVIFKHKIKLNGGQGQGEFFVPPSTPSGSYKLIGYTRWMLNMGQEAFFNTDITIVNPYKELDVSMRFTKEQEPTDSILPIQTATADTILPKEEEFYQITIPKGKYSKEELINTLLNGVPDSLWSDQDRHSRDSIAKIELPTMDFTVQAEYNDFEIVLPKKAFGKREFVGIEISNNTAPLVKGVFSISVRKIDSLPRPSLPNPINEMLLIQSGLNQVKLGGSIFLPELRGELITGTLVSGSGQLSDQKVAISLSKTYPVIKTAITDEKGRFFVNINEEDRKGEMQLLVLGDNADGTRIVLDKPNQIDHEKFTFEQLKISPDMVKIILERNVHNQIESAYFHKRNDSTIIENTEHKLLKDLSDVYLLDDYQRFSNLRETIVEILDNVWIKKEKDDYKIQIRGTESFFVDSNEVPLVLVDGFVVKDINNLLEYDIKQIESITVSQDKYYVGAQVFHGVLSISTRDQNFASFEEDGIYEERLLPSLGKKKYFFQGYGDDITDAQRKYPDFRYQLFWQPQLEIKEKKTEVGFYTSDNVGDFRIVVQGYTRDGKPVSLSEIIKVE